MRRILIVFGISAAVMLFAFNRADWYANNAALPRYCENPEAVIEIVKEILTDENASEGKEKRNYIVSAKLIFLVPQLDAESVEDYSHRLRVRISEICGQPY